MRGVNTKGRFQTAGGGARGECQYAHMYSVRVEFGEDWTIYAQLISDFVFCGEQ